MEGHRPVTIQAQLTINVFNPCALYDTALAAYMRGGASREDAESTLGTPAEPNLVNCLVEIWADTAPVNAGYEFITYE